MIRQPVKQVRGLGSMQGCCVDRGAAMVLEEPMNFKLDYLGIGDLYSGKGGLGSVQGYWTDRSTVSANRCVLVNLESAECVPELENFCLYQPKRRGGTHPSVSMDCVIVVRHCY